MGHNTTACNTKRSHVARGYKPIWESPHGTDLSKPHSEKLWSSSRRTVAVLQAGRAEFSQSKEKKIRQMPVLTSLYTRWNWGHRFKIHRESSVSQAGCQRTSHESPENAVLRAFLSVCWRTSLTHQDDGRESKRGEVQPEATAGTHGDRKSRGGMEER